jgi:sulfur-oxidizing protein SoxZ
MARALVTVPPGAKAGEIIEIRTLMAHPMETGYRSGDDGKPLPRNILRRFECRFEGEPVFSAALYPAIAANPLVSFFMRASASGTLTFRWEGDNGFAQTETVVLTVT